MEALIRCAWIVVISRGGWMDALNRGGLGGCAKYGWSDECVK